MTILESIKSALITPRSSYWRIPAYLLIGAAAFAAVFFGWLNHYYSGDENNAPVKVWTSAKPAKEVSDMPKVSTPIKGGAINAYTNKAKIDLNIPKVIRDDPAQQVIAATTVKSDDHPHTVITTVNTETGQTETIYRKDPLPWIAWSDNGGVGMYAGIKNGTPTVRLQARQELFAVKAIHFGGLASIDQPINGPISADYFVGVGAEYRW